VHTNCQFLQVDDINNEEEAVTWSINAAVQRGNAYCSQSGRERFRDEWKKELRRESQRYRDLATALSDSEHCKIIGGIADRLSSKFAPRLNGGRLRIGTSQKAFNLYLKYLWHFGDIAEPPHCPFDAVVLGRKLNMYDAWTQSDDENAYMGWVKAARKRAGAISIPEWECVAWLCGRGAQVPFFRAKLGLLPPPGQRRKEGARAWCTRHPRLPDFVAQEKDDPGRGTRATRPGLHP
jgi:hypothetical protein